MRTVRVWKQLLGVEHTVIEDVVFEGEGDAAVLVVLVHPTRSRRSRCSRCGRRCRGYDQGAGRRRWRALDLGTVQTYLEADAPRPRHSPPRCACPRKLAHCPRKRTYEISYSELRSQSQ